MPSQCAACIYTVCDVSACMGVYMCVFFDCGPRHQQWDDSQ